MANWVGKCYINRLGKTCYPLGFGSFKNIKISGYYVIFVIIAQNSLMFIRFLSQKYKFDPHIFNRYVCNLGQKMGDTMSLCGLHIELMSYTEFILKIEKKLSAY